MCAPSASQLDLSGNTIGGHYEDDGYDSDGDEQIKFVSRTHFVTHPEGVQAIAGALRVNGALTKCDLKGNYMGEEGNASIRDAVQGKTGFMLHL